MGMADDLSEIKAILHGINNAVNCTEEIRDKLKYDIEPKLNRALEGKTATEAAPKLSPDDMLRAIRYAIIYATSERKIEAIKELRKVTNAGLKEAKDTADWITAHMDKMVAQQKNKEETF